MKKNLGIGFLIFIVFIWVTVTASNFSQSAPKNVEMADTQKVEATLIHRDIVVTYQTVKEIDGKYRYFFDVRNNDSVPIEATVKIELLKENGSIVGRDTFKPTKAIRPGYGDGVFLDINTGPYPDFNKEFAVTKFRYEATINGKMVSEGGGDL